MTVPITIMHGEIKNGNVKGVKIPRKLNPADIGTKALPASILYRLSHQLREQKYYPAPESKHGRLMQVDHV